MAKQIPTEPTKSADQLSGNMYKTLSGFKLDFAHKIG
jgi:hypothetical protein